MARNKAPIRPEEFPRFFIAEHQLTAFHGPKEVYKIAPVGSNSGNEGLTIDRYKTRKMVIKLWRSYKTEVIRSEFESKMTKLFNTTFDKILNK